jgi:mRNA interferase MazF
MGVFAAGAVVLIPFPYSDLSQAKMRPAVVLADAGRGDVVLCQVTSNAYADPSAVELTGIDFIQGALRHTSYARPAKLFTVSASLAVRRIGVLGSASRDRIVDAVVDLLRPESSN